MIKLKRAYEKPSSSDGLRILVERLWPRGVKKAAARIDVWFKDIAPSPNLRKWYSHDPAKWLQFQARYKREIKQNKETFRQFKALIGKKTVTFVFAARDEKRNSAVVLKNELQKR